MDNVDKKWPSCWSYQFILLIIGITNAIHFIYFTNQHSPVNIQRRIGNMWTNHVLVTCDYYA